jgi:hypothetical protein
LAGGAVLLADHVPGMLFTLTEAGWLVMELAQCVLGRRPAGRPGRASAAGRDQRGFWFGLCACFAAATAVSSLAPFAVPAARDRAACCGRLGRDRAAASRHGAARLVVPDAR